MGGHTVKTLAHESIHIEQGNNQNEFDQFYIDRLDYYKPQKIEIPPSILKDTVTNPDGPDSDWVRKIDGEWFWFVLKLQQGGKPIGMAFKCIVVESDCFAVTENGVPLSQMTHAFDGETNSYAYYRQKTVRVVNLSQRRSSRFCQGTLKGMHSMHRYTLILVESRWNPFLA